MKSLKDVEAYIADKENIGKPKHFNVSKYLECVEMMIRSDEVERALHMLDNMPSYYRENKPEEALQLKGKLLSQIMTASDYWREPHQELDMLNDFASYPRLDVILDIVKKHEDDSTLIYDIGPGNFWMIKEIWKKYLHKNDLEYMFDGIAQMSEAPSDVYDCRYHRAKINIFCAFELIEHLWREEEIVQYYHTAVSKINVTGFDYILLSTPCHTYFGGSDSDWKETKLGHLRCYSPQEFTMFAAKHWPGYEWQIFKAPSMVLIGKKK